MSKLHFVFVILVFAIHFSLSANEFEKYLSQQNDSFLNDDIAFEKQKDKEKHEFELYRQQVLKAYSQYKKQIGAYWGKENEIVSNNRIWAEYYENMTQRHVVDFERGQVEVDVIIEESERNNKSLIQDKLNKAVVQTLTTSADNRSILEIAKHPSVDIKQKNTNDAILNNQVKSQSGEVVTATNAEAFARETTEKSLTIKSHQGTDGVSRLVASTQFTLVPNHIRQRAERFKLSVNKYAKEYDVSQNLIYAVIETESFFNPAARSSAPAFGLMQLVPHYGAREAYRFVHKKDTIPTDTYLYNANNNIELGTAYLHVLYFEHMKEIKNNESRLLSSIASYNTGPTNLYSAVIGKYKRSQFRKYAHWKNKAVNEINKMSSDQLFQHLRQHLPYQETRSYIKKVRSRMDKYTSM